MPERVRERYLRMRGGSGFRLGPVGGLPSLFQSPGGQKEAPISEVYLQREPESTCEISTKDKERVYITISYTSQVINF
jgi:hypothetical protein